MEELNQLTPGERRVYEFVRRQLRRQSCAPSLREIAVHCGFKSQASVSSYLDSLQQKGLVSRERGKERTIRLARQPTRALPLLGRIGAGGLQEAIEDQGSLDMGALLGKEGLAVLEVEDDSLVGLAIPAGSFLVIDPTCGWRRVVAMIRPAR